MSNKQIKTEIKQKSQKVDFIINNNLNRGSCLLVIL